jgi:hypothetical protein
MFQTRGLKINKKMKKLVKEYLVEFERGLEPKVALGIGRVAKIQNLFRNLDIPDKDYTITPIEIIFNFSLNLSDKNVTWLPNNLQILGNLNLNNASITKLPDYLNVRGSIDLMDTLITELPNGVKISGNIWVDLNQTQLINFIENSQFSRKIRIVK